MLPFWIRFAIPRVHRGNTNHQEHSFWRSELRNVLVLSIRRRVMSFSEALEVMEDADLLMGENDRDSGSFRILRLAADSGCSAYDCEFVALALDLGVPLLRRTMP